jgi:hypothetical protein
MSPIHSADLWPHWSGHAGTSRAATGSLRPMRLKPPRWNHWPLLYGLRDLPGSPSLTAPALSLKALCLFSSDGGRTHGAKFSRGP